MAEPAWALNSADSITVTVPAGSGSVPVVVHTPDGDATGLSFAYRPSVSAITPGAAVEGSTVTITGTDLGATSSVEFGNTPATGLQVNSADSITVTVPAGAGTDPVLVQTPDGNATISFSYQASATGITPGAGIEGTAVTITGTDLVATSSGDFGGLAATGLQINSPDSITVDVPAGSGTEPVVVHTHETGTRLAALTFTYQSSASGITPNAGIEGTTRVHHHRHRPRRHFQRGLRRRPRHQPRDRLRRLDHRGCAGRLRHPTGRRAHPRRRCDRPQLHLPPGRHRTDADRSATLPAPPSRSPAPTSVPRRL